MLSSMGTAGQRGETGVAPGIYAEAVHILPQRTRHAIEDGLCMYDECDIPNAAKQLPAVRRLKRLSANVCASRQGPSDDDDGGA